MNDIEKRDPAFIPEIMDDDRHDFSAGDYVTRDGDDILFVEKHRDDLIDVVCIVPSHSEYMAPGETEGNLTRRYCKINKHFLKFARSEHEILKKQYPDGWPEDKPALKPSNAGPLNTIPESLNPSLPASLLGGNP